jgi:hypothetical protein
MIIFLIPSLFSLLHLKRYIGLAKLLSGPQSFNCIEFDLFVFNFIPCHLNFFFIKFNPLCLIPFYFAFIFFILNFIF